MAKFIIGILEKKANQEFANLLSQKTGDSSITADNIVAIAGSNCVNAWQHAYISGMIFQNVKSIDISLLSGILKEFIALTWWGEDTSKDLYNNKKGIEISKNYENLEDFKNALFDSLIDVDSNTKLFSPKYDELIIDAQNDDRINGINLFQEITTLPAFLDSVYSSRDIDMPENMINDLYDQYNGYRGKFHSAGDCECTPKDPIIFDLNNDGVLETTDINNGIYFDHENDGFAEASAWVGKNDGILFSDNNNNNSLDNGSELITADNLAQFDTNGDGVIDANDDNFGNLKIIKGDGTILTLEEAGISSISASTNETDRIDENGNQQFADGTFTKTDGTTGEMGAFYFETETSESLSNEWLNETEDIENLPDIDGRGKLYSLHQAMRHVA